MMRLTISLPDVATTRLDTLVRAVEKEGCMPDSEEYIALVRRTGLDPRLRRVATIQPEDPDRKGPIVELRPGEHRYVDGFGDVHFLAVEEGGAFRQVDGLFTTFEIGGPVRDTRPVIALPSGLRVSGYRYEPVVANGLPPEPETNRDYWARIDDLKRAFEPFGERAVLRDLGAVPCGWLPLIETALRAIAAVLGPEDRFEVRQIKEKFGDLRFYARHHCADPTVAAYIADIRRWAEVASYSRCAVSGRAGRNAPLGGWWITLSDDLRARAEADPTFLDGKLYPPEPEEDERCV